MQIEGGRERILRIMRRQNTGRPGFWMGAPVWETQQAYFRHFGVDSLEALSVVLRSDAFWVPAEYGAYHAPQGGAIFPFDPALPPLADCESIREVEAYPWPDPSYLDYTPILVQMQAAIRRGQAVLGGPWSPIFQTAVDLFGMEELFIRMHTDPELVEAAVEHIVAFYVEAGSKLLAQGGEWLDVFFFANDLGSQQDLLISPEMLRRFFLPGFGRLVEMAKGYGVPVIMHSCGAIRRAIPMLIEIGIDGLHPLQAGARGMEPEALAREYGRDLVFMGGIDTQRLLPQGTEEQVRREVKRLYDALGSNWIVSASHEGILPDVPPQNIAAMRDSTYALAQGATEEGGC